MKKVLALIMVLSMVLALCACGQTAASPTAPPAAASEAAPEAPAAEPVTIRFGHSGTEEHQYHVFASKFKELIEEKSEGRINVEIYTNAVLGNDREMIEGMLNGQQEMFVGSSTTSWVPETAVTDMPFLYRDYDHAYACLNGFLFDELGSRFEDSGLELLGYVPIGWRNISNNVKPINSAADLQGMKIRIPDMEVYSVTFTALGATTVTCALSELYMGLQQGIADGQDNPASTFCAQSFQEVQKYVSLTHHMLGTNFVLCNLDWLSSLSADDQALIKECSKEAMDYQWDFLRNAEDGLVQKIKDAGVEVNEPTDIESFRTACAEVPEKLGTVPMEWIEQIRGM